MLSLIEVTCPHCAARGQIMLPPLGAIVIGPCPECNGMVVVFCGQILPLDRDIMNGGSNAEKRGHVGAILSDFVRERVERLFAQEGRETDTPTNMRAHPEDASPAPSAFDAGIHPGHQAHPDLSAISLEEVNSFVNVDLRLLDNPEYFKAIFER